VVRILCNCKMFKSIWLLNYSISHQIRSVAQSCPTLCDPMNRSTPGLPVHHQLPEFTQTHVHRVSDAIQPSHPLSSPSPPAPNPSQHQSFFQWVNYTHTRLAKKLIIQKISYAITYTWNFLKCYKWTYLWNRNRLTDLENKPIVCNQRECGRG